MTSKSIRARTFLTGALGRGLTRSDLRSAVKRRYLASLHVRNIKKAGGQVSILDHFGTHAMRAISQNLISRKNTSKEQRRPRAGRDPRPNPVPCTPYDELGVGQNQVVGACDRGMDQ